MSTEIEFPSGAKEIADAVRDDHREHLCSDDDARLLTVTFSSDAPEHVVEDAQRRAQMARGELEDRAGQVDLTDSEKDRIDFSKGRANVPHARSVKAIARKNGVDDWLAHYDPTLTVDEHREVMEQAGQEGGGKRMDSHENRAEERAAEAAARAQAGECDHARGHCEHGDPEACEYLQDVCGYSEEEVDDILGDDPETEQEITGQAAGALQRSCSGYKAAISEIEESINEYLGPEWDNAQQAARAINEIRAQHGQDPIHFDRLEELQAQILDLARKMAADCHECHADHSAHGHQTTSGDRENVTEAVVEGADATPVGTSTDPPGGTTDD